MELALQLKRLSQVDKFPFHMPGHKNEFPELFGQFDPTELPGLDNLHSPQDIIKKAQARVADIYGVAKTYFLVNGSSVGLMAGLASVARPGDCVLVPRNCHKAVVAGFIHSGAMPLWLEPEFSSVVGHWHPPSAKQVAEMLAVHPIRAAIFTNPDYYGLAPDIKAIAQLCHQAGIRVLVDEAHGAHLRFGEGLALPKSAVCTECDIIVQSPHKTLPALTQSAWMHVAQPGLAEVVQDNLNLFHTTSPSYLLLASLEYAGAFAKAHGFVLFRHLRVWAKMLELRSRQLGSSVFPHNKRRDWTKFTLVNKMGMEDMLARAGIFPELVQGDKALFMLTMADAVNTAGLQALYEILPKVANLPELPVAKVSPPPVAWQECPPREAWLRKGQRVPLTEALGRISRQIIAPYPPGTMVVAPGQRLTKDVVQYLAELAAGKVISQWIEVI